MIGGIGMPELIVILVIILIIFGAGKLPEIGTGIGKGIKNFRKATKDMNEEVKESLDNRETSSLPPESEEKETPS